MGFLDKVKSTVSDVSDTVSKKIETEKYEMKIRDEQKKIDRESTEIGKIVAKVLLEGGEFDPFMVEEHLDIIRESNRKIDELIALRDGISGEDQSDYDDEDDYHTSYKDEDDDLFGVPMPPVSKPEPQPEALPEPEQIIESEPAPEPESIQTQPEYVEPEPEPIIEEPIQEGPALEPGEWMCSCGSINSTKFCMECGMKKPEIQVAEPASVAESEPVPEPEPQPVQQTSQSDVQEEGSMLSRMQSYKSNQYSGGKL